MSAVELALLGPLRLSVADETVGAIGSRKALALLGFIAARGEPVARSRLVALLWGTLEQRAGRRNLSWAIHALERALPGLIERGRDELSIDTTSLDLDIVRFESLVGRGTVEARREALALYRGNFMEGLEQLDGCPGFERWLGEQQQWWQQRILEMLSGLAGDYERDGRFDEGVAVLSRAITIAPWLESAHHELIRQLALAGRRAEALRHFERAREQLERELGAPPSPETIELVAAVREGTVKATPNSRATDPRHEIASLLEEPSCRLLTLVNPGGKGSSAEARHVAEWWRQQRGESVRLSAARFVDARELVASLERELAAVTEGGALLALVEQWQAPLPGAERLSGLLRRAPGLRILIVARAPLGLRAEWLYDLV